MSQVSKLKYVDAKLGAPTGGQQTTRVLFHTIKAPGTARVQEFFTNFQGLTPGQTNLTQNKLDSSESMVVKTIWLYQPGGDSNTAQGAIFGGGLRGGLVLDFIVGNQKVIKDLPLNFNAGMGEPFDRIHANNGVVYNPSQNANGPIGMPCEIRLLTDIVIPPQVSFSVVVKASPGNDFGTAAIICALSGYGKIFSAGSSF